jgi:hypothetical protein
MERIKGQTADFEELAKQILSWIICAKKPLTTLELQHAIAIEAEEPQLDEENLCLVEDMVSVCAGLVTVDREAELSGWSTTQPRNTSSGRGKYGSQI